MQRFHSEGAPPVEDADDAFSTPRSPTTRASGASRASAEHARRLSPPPATVHGRARQLGFVARQRRLRRPAASPRASDARRFDAVASDAVVSYAVVSYAVVSYAVVSYAVVSYAVVSDGR